MTHVCIEIHIEVETVRNVKHIQPTQTYHRTAVICNEIDTTAYASIQDSVPNAWLVTSKDIVQVKQGLQADVQLTELGVGQIIVPHIIRSHKVGLGTINLSAPAKTYLGTYTYRRSSPLTQCDTTTPAITFAGKRTSAYTNLLT